MKKMRRYLALLLAVAMMISMVQYGGSSADATETGAADTTVEAVVDAEKAEEKTTEAKKAEEEEEKTTEAVEAEKAEKAEEATTEAEEAEEKTTEAVEAEGKTAEEKTAEEETTEASSEESSEEAKSESEADTTAASEEETTEEAAPTRLTYEDEDVKVTVKAVDKDSIPVGATLRVKQISKNDSQYEEAQEQLESKAEEEGYSVAGFLLYDISLVNEDGDEVEPNGEVKVTMDYNKAVAAAEDESVLDTDESLDVILYHLEEDEDGKVQEVVNMVEEADAVIETTDEAKVEKVEFVTESFSDYGIMTVWGDSTSGTFDHIEIDIAGNAKLTVDNVSYEAGVTVSTSDTFYMRAYTLESSGNKTYVEPGWSRAEKVSESSSSWYGWYTGGTVTTGDGSTTGATVKLSGSFSSGTKSSPIYYEVALVQDVTFTLNDGTTMTVTVTLTMTTYYWDNTNECPGVHNPADEDNWINGYFISKTGIDYPVTGEVIGQAITEGKLAIQKTVSNDSASNETFTFTVQNSKGEYVTFEENAYAGTSATLTSACYVTVAAGSTSTVLTGLPAGVYTITEVQKKGYIITNIDGEYSTTNYSKDYTITTKSDDAIPVANFTNAKLTDKAGISIAKVASGLGSSDTYPNPTVSIYAYDSTTQAKTGDAVWTGTLTANGDRLYLTTLLEAGTYIIEESNETKDGYNVNTSLTGGSDIDGLVFTVETGTRYDLTITNVYSEKPKTGSLAISKAVTGDGSTTKAFTFTVVLKDSSGAALSGQTYTTTTKTTGETTETSGSVTTNEKGEITVTLKHDQTIEIEGLPDGATYTVTETSVNGYTTTSTESTGIITSGTTSTAAFTNRYTGGSTDVTVTKNWNDQGNAYSTRPKSITVYLYQDDGSTAFKTQLVEPDSSGNWSYTFEGLPKYDTNGDEYTYTVREEAVGSYTSTVNDYTITNTLKFDWKMVKRSASNNSNLLGGAKFTLTKDGTVCYWGVSAEGTGEVTWYTDSDCTAAAESLSDGTYTLAEITAPDGYMKSTETWTVDVASGVVKVIGNTNTCTSATDDSTGEVTVTFTYDNTMLYELPSAGGAGIYTTTLGGMLLMMCSAFMLIMYKRKERGEVRMR